jgi:hypothetical protein
MLKKLFLISSLSLVSAFILASCMGGGGSKKSANYSGLSQEGQIADGIDCPNGSIGFVDGVATCIEPQGSSNECETSSDCDVGFDCVGNACQPIGNTGTCACSNNLCCSTHSNCNSTKFCKTETTPKCCEDRKPVDTLCSVSYCSNFCKSGQFYTEGTQKKCGCAVNADCTGMPSGRTTCNVANKRCVKIVSLNQSCSDPNTTKCDINLACTSGTCKKATGQPCTSATASDCATGICGAGDVCALVAGGCQQGQTPMGGACTQATASCCESGFCRADNTCGCENHAACAANQYCNGINGYCTPGCVSVGICLVGGILQACDAIVGSCANGYYCRSESGQCVLKCTASGGSNPCQDLVGDFCDTNTGICENKLEYNGNIPSGFTAATACTQGVAQRVNMVATNKCGCSADAYCTSMSLGTGGCSATNHVCINKNATYGTQCGDVSTSQGNCSSSYVQKTQVGCDDCVKNCTLGKWYYDGGRFYCGCTAVGQCPAGSNGLCTPTAGMEPYRCIALKSMDSACLIPQECAIGACDTVDHLCGIGYEHSGCGESQSKCSNRWGNNLYCDADFFATHGCGYGKCCGKKPNPYLCDHGYQCISGSCPSTKCKN